MGSASDDTNSQSRIFFEIFHLKELVTSILRIKEVEIYFILFVTQLPQLLPQCQRQRPQQR